MNIRLGTEQDIEALARLYDDVNDYLAETINYPGWKKGIYPIRQTAEDGINEKALFIVEIEDSIVGSMILRHKQEKAYYEVKWQQSLDDSEVFVLYTFVVHPDFLRKKVAKQMLDFATRYTVEHKAISLRLDVYEHNSPAISLYKNFGFRYIDTVSLGLEEYGLNWFKLYEKLCQVI